MLQKWLLKIQTYFLRKPKFAKWCRLEDRKYEVIEAIEGSSPNLPNIFESYLSVAFNIPVNFSKIPWQDALEAFYKLHSVSSTVRKIPITDNQNSKKSEKDVWDYSGRLWYLYANIIASAYGWSEKVISNLSVDDALAYLQEILTDKQLDKEFVWQTSEIAHPYDERTKKSKFSPLERPYWMVKPKVLRKAPAIPKALLPVGNVVRISNDKTKKTELGRDMETVSSSETGN